jgi:uncharacterized surface protein with fasciclin (FAS1) repeats
MVKSRVIIAALGLIAISASFAAPSAIAGQPERAETKPNIVQVARGAGSFQTLIKALEATDLIGTLSGQGHGTFTVFAPTDEAFAKLGETTLASLLSNPAELKKILLYHVVPGEYPASSVVSAATLPTVNGKSLTISTAGGVKVDNANVISTDIAARNGVIHVIDSVLIP